jgi:hypothetical protein
VGARRPRRVGDPLVAGARIGQREIRSHRVVEQERVLRHQREERLRLLGLEVGKRHASQQDPALRRIEEAEQQRRDRRLPGPRRTDDRDGLPRRHVEREAVEREPVPPAVPEANVLEPDRRGHAVDVSRLLGLRDERRRAEEREDTLGLGDPPDRLVHAVVDLPHRKEALAGQQQRQQQLAVGHGAIGDAHGANPQRQTDPGARRERHESPKRRRHARDPDRGLLHVVRPREQLGAPPPGGPERLERAHPLQVVHELRGQRPVAVGPEPHPRSEGPVLERRRQHHEGGEHGHDGADHRVQDEDGDDHAHGRDRRHDDLREEEAVIGVHLLDAVDQHRRQVAGALARGPAGA